MSVIGIARRPEDPHAAADDRELDVAAVVLDVGLAGEPEAAGEVGLGLGPWRQTLGALADLDDALPAATRPSARRRHGRRDLVGVVEEARADDQRPVIGPVDGVWHSRLLTATRGPGPRQPGLLRRPTIARW